MCSVISFIIILYLIFLNVKKSFSKVLHVQLNEAGYYMYTAYTVSIDPVPRALTSSHRFGDADGRD